MHKKTTNWSILVVVVKWRHRAIVLILRLLAKDRGNTLRKKKQFKCTQMNIKGLYAETHYGLLFFSVKPLSSHPTHEKASCETLYHMSIWWQSYKIKRGCARSMDLPWSPERGKIRSRWNRRLSFFWKDANKISHDFAKKKFLAQICISVIFRGGVFFRGVPVIFFTCDFFPGSWQANSFAWFELWRVKYFYFPLTVHIRNQIDF